MPKPKTHPVRALRQKLGLSGSELARRAGLSSAHLCDIERGRTPLPRVDFALALAEELKTDVRRLFPRAKAAHQVAA